MVSIVGTANMDIRSFDLNFEIMSIIYGNDFATELESAFFDDLEQSSEVILQQWQEISLKNKLLYAIARLISSFL
jgi:cardiolipin synthase